MSRSLIALALVLGAAGAAQAQSRGDKPVSESKARASIEHSGYSNPQYLHREGNSSWTADARDKHGAGVIVGVDAKGRTHQISH